MKKRRYKKSSPAPLIVIIIMLMALVCIVIVRSANRKADKNNSIVSSKIVSSEEEVSSVESVQSSAPSDVQASSVISSSKITSSKVETAVKLDPDYERMILVNGDNALPKDYNYTDNLVTIPSKYLCGWRNQMDKDAWVYTKAMIEAAWKDGVELYILSPYRSYETQETLFANEVKKWEKQGYKGEAAKEKASTVVARPGTSEHHTGLAIDFNSVDHSFENTEMFKWLEMNAADYGFIMRYSEEKQPITGVIHESWHWRFVGIKHARKISEQGICFEEYVETLGD